MPARASMSAAPTITPARKHRKLLKDGSGAEVWPEAIERLFVQGLKAYRDSPYASPQGRGRSRWRNQYLVEYLQNNGITRTKKQVASHIQVLRNMWKGQAEYSLVAGGDDQFLESDLQSSVRVKLEDRIDTSNLISMEADEPDSPSTSSPTYKPDFLPSPTSPYDADTCSPDSVLTSLSNDSPRTIASLPATPESFTAQLVSGVAPVKVAHSPLRQGHLPEIRSDELLYSPTEQKSPLGSPQSSDSWDRPSFGQNRVTSFSLTADGMIPFQVKVDALVSPPDQGYTAPVLIQTRLAVPPVSDARCPPSFNGFAGVVTIANVWSHFAKCTTKVFVGRECIARETDALDVSRIDLGTVVAALPASQLSQCRWLDPAIQTHIMQDIIVDNVPIFKIVYQLDRSARIPYPSVELVGYSKIPRPSTTKLSFPESPNSPSYYSAFGSPSPLSPYSQIHDTSPTIPGYGPLPTSHTPHHLTTSPMSF